MISTFVAALNAGGGKLVYSLGYADGADGQGIAPSGEIEIVSTLAGDAEPKATSTSVISKYWPLILERAVRGIRATSAMAVL